MTTDTSGWTILITGGAGFIGSNLVRRLLHQREDLRIINLDSLTYAGNLESLQDIEDHPRYKFVKADLVDLAQIRDLFEKFTVDAIMHLAAESHVDRSILDPSVFVSSNVLGTQNLLNCAREFKVKRFLQVSTDEVYGSLGSSGAFTEMTPLSPNSPYSASKAGADLLARAAFKTHGLAVLTTRCSNNYGPYQFPEKLIPLMISNALQGEPLPVYGDGTNVRDWLHVEDHCDALWTVLEGGTAGEVYNIGGNCEKQNIELVRQLLALLKKDESLIQLVADRPGHDLRYAIDASKIRDELGWEPARRFDEGLAETVSWYQENQEWVARVKSGTYRDYYARQYADRL